MVWTCIALVLMSSSGPCSTLTPEYEQAIRQRATSPSCVGIQTLDPRLCRRVSSGGPKLRLCNGTVSHTVHPRTTLIAEPDCDASGALACTAPTPRIPPQMQRGRRWTCESQHAHQHHAAERSSQAEVRDRRACERSGARTRRRKRGTRFRLWRAAAACVPYSASEASSPH